MSFAVVAYDDGKHPKARYDGYDGTRGYRGAAVASAARQASRLYDDDDGGRHVAKRRMLARADLNVGGRETDWRMRPMGMPPGLNGRDMGHNAFDRRVSNLPFVNNGDVAVNEKGYRYVNERRPLTIAMRATDDEQMDAANSMKEHLMWGFTVPGQHAGGLDFEVSTMSSLRRVFTLPGLIRFLNTPAGLAAVGTDMAHMFKMKFRPLGVNYSSDAVGETKDVRDDTDKGRVLVVTDTGKGKVRNYWAHDPRSYQNGTYLAIVFKYGVPPLAAARHENRMAGEYTLPEGDLGTKEMWYAEAHCLDSKVIPDELLKTKREYTFDVSSLATLIPGFAPLAEHPAPKYTDTHYGVGYVVGVVHDAGAISAERMWTRTETDALINPFHEDGASIYKTENYLDTISVLLLGRQAEHNHALSRGDRIVRMGEMGVDQVRIGGQSVPVPRYTMRGPTAEDTKDLMNDLRSFLPEDARGGAVPPPAPAPVAPAPVAPAPAPRPVAPAPAPAAASSSSSSRADIKHDDGSRIDAKSSGAAESVLNGIADGAAATDADDTSGLIIGAAPSRGGGRGTGGGRGKKSSTGPAITAAMAPSARRDTEF